MRVTFVDLGDLVQSLYALGLPGNQFGRLYCDLKGFGQNLPVLQAPLGYVVLSHERELGAVVARSLPFGQRADYVRFFYPASPTIVEVDHSKGLPIPKGISVNLKEYNDLVMDYQRDKVKAMEAQLQRDANLRALPNPQGAKSTMSQEDALRELEGKIRGRPGT